MEINGREIKFRRTIGATLKIAALCPDNDLKKLKLLLNGDPLESNLTAAAMVSILSDAAETHEALVAARAGREYVPDPLTIEEILDIQDEDVVKKLIAEANEAFGNDGKRTVAAEPKKKQTSKPKKST